MDPEQRQAQRREQLLEAALDLFARHGYFNTSIEQICQTAYVGNKAFYESFGSKEDCFLALLHQLGEQVQQRVRQAAEQAAGHTPDETMRLLLTAFVHAFTDDRRIAAVAYRDVGGISPDVERQRRANRQLMVTFIEATWRQLGLVDSAADAHALATGTAGALFEIVAAWLHNRNSDDAAPDTLIEDLMDYAILVRTGLAARRGLPG